ncbi:response regulator [Pectinatus frisingensis]|uniref:response regulator n=1 Tax=Pectinatus frisingensis TaxID=865 RepID=UPI0018C626F7|nr:response regulator [Pectinatus frisingensis]
MRFMIVDDDSATRFMLQDIIEDCELGKVISSLDSAVDVDNELLTAEKIDILIIDLLMPVCDGIQTVKSIKADFLGKIIMLSQVENKEMVGNAYSLGVDSYITKPINRNEVVGVIKEVSKHICLKKFVSNIQNDLHNLSYERGINKDKSDKKMTITERGNMVLRDLGIESEAGSKDLLEVIGWLGKNLDSNANDFPALKTIFTQLVNEKTPQEGDCKKIKAVEQRVRRTIFQAMVNIASMGIVDCTNPKFDDYSSRYFDLAEIYALMRTLEKDEKPQISNSHINSKKFIRTLYIESHK